MGYLYLFISICLCTEASECVCRRRDGSGDAVVRGATITERWVLSRVACRTGRRPGRRPATAAPRAAAAVAPRRSAFPTCARGASGRRPPGLCCTSARLTSGRTDTPVCIIQLQLFSSLAVLDPRVGHTMDVPSPFISVLCHSD